MASHNTGVLPQYNTTLKFITEYSSEVSTDPEFACNRGSSVWSCKANGYGNASVVKICSQNSRNFKNRLS